MPITFTPGEVKPLNVQLAAPDSYPIWHIADQKAALAWNTHEVTVARPNNVSAGDLLVALVSTDFSYSVSERNYPFNLIAKIPDPDTPQSWATTQSFYRIATSNEPSSYTFRTPDPRPPRETPYPLNSGFVLMGRVTNYGLSPGPVDGVYGRSSDGENHASIQFFARELPVSVPTSLLITFTSHWLNVEFTRISGFQPQEILDIALRSIRIADLIDGQPTWSRTIEYTPANRVAGQMFNIRPK